MSKPFRLPPVTEIVVACPPGQTLAAELRGGDVWALHWHWDDQPSMLGAVHSIRVTRLAPEANGAFAVADEAGPPLAGGIGGAGERVGHEHDVVAAGGEGTVEVIRERRAMECLATLEREWRELSEAEGPVRGEHGSGGGHRRRRRDRPRSPLVPSWRRCRWS